MSAVRRNQTSMTEFIIMGYSTYQDMHIFHSVLISFNLLVYLDGKCNQSSGHNFRLVPSHHLACIHDEFIPSWDSASFQS